MRTTHARVILVLSLLIAALPAAAADICELGDTIEECWQKITAEPTRRQNEATERASAVTKAGVKAELKNEETGLDGGAAALATTTRNLLPLLAASGLVSDSDGNSEDQLFAIDLNFLIPGTALDKNAQFKAILNTAPTMFDDLKTAFDTATGNTDRSGALQDDLSAADDYTLSFTYNHISDQYGRAPEQQNERFDRLFGSAITVAMQKAKASATVDPAIQMANALQVLGVEDGSFVLSDQKMLDAVENAALFDNAIGQQLRAATAKYQLPRFSDLVNNQPQVLLSAELHERDPLVGAKETAIKLTYEFGFASVNDMVRKTSRQCGGFAAGSKLDADQAEACLAAYDNYITDNDAVLRNADRMSLEVSYVEVEDYEFESVDDGVTFARDGTKRLDVALGYGRTVKALGAERDSRIDLVAKYEDYSDDVDHQDRMVATLTLTTKLNGVAIPFSLVYANHEKFLPDSDDQVSAHIGIKYQFDPKEK